MNSYQLSPIYAHSTGNAAERILANVIRQLRGEGFRVWSEADGSKLFLVTDAKQPMINLCAGNTWTFFPV